MSECVIRQCRCCGLVQELPAISSGFSASCARCGSRLAPAGILRRAHDLTAPLALAAIIIYPLAVTLPIIRIEQFGHRSESSVVDAVTAFFANGNLFVGMVVLLCSIVFPLGKLIGLMALTSERVMRTAQHRALTHSIIEWTGRWGMLDVLLVAILVAVVKLGDVMDVVPGPGALAFTICVVLSLVSIAVFDPHRYWETHP